VAPPGRAFESKKQPTRLFRVRLFRAQPSVRECTPRRRGRVADTNRRSSNGRRDWLRHVVVSMEVTTPSGTENWSITSRWTPTILRKLGWNRNSVAAGDEVVITYLPHVSAPTVGHMQTIVVNGKALALQD
jgi:hypothetical protein